MTCHVPPEWFALRSCSHGCAAILPLPTISPSRGTEINGFAHARPPDSGGDYREAGGVRAALGSCGCPHLDFWGVWTVQLVQSLSRCNDWNNRVLCRLCSANIIQLHKCFLWVISICCMFIDLPVMHSNTQVCRYQLFVIASLRPPSGQWPHLHLRRFVCSFETTLLLWACNISDRSEQKSSNLMQLIKKEASHLPGN